MQSCKLPTWELTLASCLRMCEQTSVRNLRDPHNRASLFNIDAQNNNLITHLFLFVKYYIYVWKFRGTKSNFIGYTTYIKSNRETEYYVAKKRGKLSNHLKNRCLIFKLFVCLFVCLGFFFIAIPFYFMGEYNVFFPLLLDCLFIVYRSDNVTLNTTSGDNCCTFFFFFMFAAIVISCDFVDYCDSFFMKKKCTE